MKPGGLTDRQRLDAAFDWSWKALDIAAKANSAINGGIDTEGILEALIRIENRVIRVEESIGGKDDE